MPTSKTTSHCIQKYTTRIWNPTNISLITKNKNNLEFIFDCVLVVAAFIAVAIALNIKNHWSWRWWRRQVEFSIQQNFYHFYCGTAVKRAFLIQFYQFLAHRHKHKHKHTFCPSNTGFVLWWPNSISFHYTHFIRHHPIYIYVYLHELLYYV